MVDPLARWRSGICPDCPDTGEWWSGQEKSFKNDDVPTVPTAKDVNPNGNAENDKNKIWEGSPEPRSLSKIGEEATTHIIGKWGRDGETQKLENVQDARFGFTDTKIGRDSRDNVDFKGFFVSRQENCMSGQSGQNLSAESGGELPESQENCGSQPALWRSPYQWNCVWKDGRWRHVPRSRS